MKTDKIVSIEEIEERESIDIEVDGNHLFLCVLKFLSPKT